MLFQHTIVLVISALAVTANINDDPKRIDEINSQRSRPTSKGDDSEEYNVTRLFDGPVDAEDNLQFATDRQLEGSLYESIYYYNYDKAVEQCRSIIRDRRQHVIKSTVDFLIESKKSQTTSFAYKLWAAGYGDVVKTQFPEEFQMVFGVNAVRFTSYWYDVPIELADAKPDSQNDKDVVSNAEQPYGNSFLWQLEPKQYKNNIYFKIRHFETNRYMKLAKHLDLDGDYLAYASPDSDTERHLWLLQPVKFDGGYLFFIINYHHYKALKLSHRLFYKIRTVFGVTDFYSHIDKYGFKVKVFRNYD